LPLTFWGFASVCPCTNAQIIAESQPSCLGAVSGSLFYQKVEKLVNEWKKEELGETAPFSPEAEIEEGLKYFLRWLKKRDEQ
jgi:hypothetical protein